MTATATATPPAPTKVTETKGEATTTRSRKAAPEPRACLCGCDGLTKSRFVPGHDARHASRLVKVALDGEASGADREEKAAGRKAAKELSDLGWTSKLDKSRKSRTAKAEAKAARAAAKAKPVESPTA